MINASHLDMSISKNNEIAYFLMILKIYSSIAEKSIFE